MPHVSTLGTVAEVLDWHEAHLIRPYSPSALSERKRIWRLFRDYMHGVPLSEALPAHLLDFITERQGVKANWTRMRWKATICAPFNEAERLGLISKNPFRGVRFGKCSRGRDWTAAEYGAILRASKPYFRQLVRFLRYSGARPGEARTLTWLDVRDDLQAIVQTQHKTAWCVDEPRCIYFNRVIVKLLLWQRRHKTHDVYVFTNSRGKPWTSDALTRTLRKIRRKVGLPAAVKLKGGRHTFATNAIMNGVDVATLAELLGHKELKTTAIYLHMANKKPHLNAAANKAIGH